jgi:hypothetical protein
MQLDAQRKSYSENMEKALGEISLIIRQISKKKKNKKFMSFFNVTIF